MMAEEHDQDESQHVFGTETAEELNDDDAIHVLSQEGDEDAVLITDFEAAASDVLQSDEELAGAFNAYTEARRRLSEKVKSRRFWPPQKGKFKGFGKSMKGKFQKGHRSNRKSLPLQQRVLTTACRLCGKVGHWKAKGPTRNDQPSSARPQAQASFVHADASQIEWIAHGIPESTCL